MSQDQTIRARNEIIFISTFISLLILGIIIFLLFDKLGTDFGASIDEIENPMFYEETVNVLLKPVGDVKVGVSDPNEPTQAAVAKAPEEGEKIIQLIQEKGYACLGCHKVDAQMVGPAYKEVANKYQGQDVYDMLAEKVKNGGVGTWGQVPMPPNPTVTDEDMKILIEEILALADGDGSQAEQSQETSEASEEESSSDEQASTESADQASDESADKSAADKEANGETADGSNPAMTTEEATAFIQEKGLACMGCHQVNSKMVGPAYKDVSDKYADQWQSDKQAVYDMLTEKIVKGGVGNWGQIPMPPNATLSEEDSHALIDWIMSL